MVLLHYWHLTEYRVKVVKRYFSGSIWFSVICSLAATTYGWTAGGITGAMSALVITIILGLMEVSLSFDNAVINAKVLNNMSLVWRKRFITWGIPIAVFGMRFLFPLVIVDLVTSLNLWEVAKLAFTNPAEYSYHLQGAHYMISAFGFGFLMMVALGWFIDPDKESHWFDPIERVAVKFHALPLAAPLLTTILLGIMLFFVPNEHRLESAVAGLVGIASQWIIHAIAEKFNNPNIASDVNKAGFASFMYLEVLDASFSLDGVIGAFAITQSVPVIMAGLAIGAIFVRSITLMLVDRGTLAEYRYLEHGAHYGIAALAIIMLLSLSPAVHIPEIVTGAIGIGFILGAVWQSKKEQKHIAVAAD